MGMVCTGSGRGRSSTFSRDKVQISIATNKYVPMQYRTCATYA